MGSADYVPVNHFTRVFRSRHIEELLPRLEQMEGQPGWRGLSKQVRSMCGVRGGVPVFQRVTIW